MQEHVLDEDLNLEALAIEVHDLGNKLARLCLNQINSATPVELINVKGAVRATEGRSIEVTDEFRLVYTGIARYGKKWGFLWKQAVPLELTQLKGLGKHTLGILKDELTRLTKAAKEANKQEVLGR